MASAIKDWVGSNFTAQASNLGTAVPIVTAALGAGTALLAAVGTGSGIAVRLLRNDPVWVAILVLVLLSSISLAAFAAKRRWLVIAGAVFFVALGGFTWLAGDVSRAAERPHLVASVETTTTGMARVTAAVKADGLRTKELIYLLARGHTRAPIDPTTGEGLSGAEVQQATNEQEPPDQKRQRAPAVLIDEAALGPNATGSIDATFSVEISPALFKDVSIMVARDNTHVTEVLGSGGPYESECIPRLPESDDKLNRACVRFILPFGAIRPLLSASLGLPNSDGNRLLSANVTGVDVPLSNVIVFKAWVGQVTRMEQTFAPDRTGKVQVTPSIYLSKSDADICLVAALVTPADRTELRRSYCDKPESAPLTVAFARL